MNLFGWQIDTWFEWGIIGAVVIILDGLSLWLFGTLIFLRILLAIVTKGDSFKGGGGRSGGGGSSSKW